MIQERKTPLKYLLSLNSTINNIYIVTLLECDANQVAIELACVVTKQEAERRVTLLLSKLDYKLWDVSLAVHTDTTSRYYIKPKDTLWQLIKEKVDRI